MLTTIIVSLVCAAVAALVAWALTHMAEKTKYSKEIAELSSSLEAQKQMRSNDAEQFEKRLADLKENQVKVLEATRNEFELENEKRLKEREEALKNEAAQTLKTVTGGLDQSIKEMKEAFEAQKKAHTEDSAAIKTKFDETVANLRTQTEAIGSQAVDLANALKGKNKMQGIFGETILENILIAEGLTAGRDYDAEFYLRDRKGGILQNEDTGKKMRPDFALHFPDDTDVIIDAKMSLTALSDYFSATTDEERRDASKRNLQSVMDHIAELDTKEYQKYIEGRKTLEYVIMFIPNYGAYQLAKQEDPDIFSKAFAKNVLITTEETLIPFLRLIRSAWVQKDQLENMAEIVAGAQRMVDRVALFCEKNVEVGNQIEKSLKLYKENTERLVEGRQSIVKAARDVVDSGVKLSPGKTLPELTD